MRNVLGLAALLVSAAGCSTAPLVGDLHTTGLESSPAQIAGQWQFNALGNDAIRESVVILTTESANTCLSGEWFKAVVVSPGGLSFSKPAYNYSDGRLELLLSSELCDAYTSLVGSVSGSRFSGAHVSYGLFGSTEQGKITGARQP
ncbi:hypothetical protein FHR47_002829 [Xanthomonas arboricola]|nr:hypothetical protein [Xanthomonas cannabis]